jgi:hypothetical protein
MLVYNTPKKNGRNFLPSTAGERASNPPDLRQALRDATSCADREAAGKPETENVNAAL